MKILFVCTGNTCRSVMAQHLFSHFAKKHHLSAETRSAGIAAERHFPTPRGIRTALGRYGITGIRNTPQLINRPAMDWATHVYAMAANHLGVLHELYPEHREKTRLFLEAAGLGKRDVDDPIGKPDERYVECCEIIEQGILRIIKNHEKHSANPRP